MSRVENTTAALLIFRGLKGKPASASGRSQKFNQEIVWT